LQQDLAPLAVTGLRRHFYPGWICRRCLATDSEDGLLDVLGVYATHEDAEWDVLTEEYYPSLEPPDLDLAEALAQAHEYSVE
jgi:hypothetical protein